MPSWTTNNKQQQPLSLNRIVDRLLADFYIPGIKLQSTYHIQSGILTTKTMMNFLSPVLLLSCGVTTTTNAFSVISSSFVTVKHHQPYQPLFVSFQRSSPSMVVLHESVTEEIETVTNTATPTDSDNDNTNVYSKIGITKNDLAIGIDPEEVLEWIGT